MNHNGFSRVLAIGVLGLVGTLGFASGQVRAERVTYSGRTNTNIPFTITIEFSTNPPQVVGGTYGNNAFIRGTLLGVTSASVPAGSWDFEIIRPRVPNAVGAGRFVDRQGRPVVPQRGRDIYFFWHHPNN